jgi:hypothetical protein
MRHRGVERHRERRLQRIAPDARRDEHAYAGKRSQRDQTNPDIQRPAQNDALHDESPPVASADITSIIL